MTLLTNARLVLPDQVMRGTISLQGDPDRDPSPKGAVPCRARSTATAIFSSPA